MASLPVEILLGAYLGILTGILPALVSWALGFGFKYVTGVTIPGFGVVVLALAIAGVNGGLLALTDRAVVGAATGPVVVVAILVVVGLSLYAHSKGDAMGATLPRRVSWRGLRERTLSSDVVELVGGLGQVRVSVTGEVGDVEGYPPLPAEVRQAIRDGEWTMPADLPLSELESQVAERLRTEYDLAEVSVSIDERGRATVAAAPSLSGLSKRVPQGKRAVSIEALVPTGLARNDEVTVLTSDAAVDGTVLSVRSDGGAPVATDGGAPDAEPPPSAPVAAGGEGRVTVAVSRSDADHLLRVDRGRVVVRARGTHREFELVSLLHRSGKRFRKLVVGSGSPLDGTTLGRASVREQYGAAVLAVRGSNGWTIAPPGATELAAGDELFVVGARDALNALAEVME